MRTTQPKNHSTEAVDGEPPIHGEDTNAMKEKGSKQTRFERPFSSSNQLSTRARTSVRRSIALGLSVPSSHTDPDPDSDSDSDSMPSLKGLKRS